MKQPHCDISFGRSVFSPRLAKNWLLAALAAVAALWLPMVSGLALDNRYPGDRAGAAKLLRLFLAPDADYRSLTLMLKPRPEDYRAAYRQPLADRLAEVYKSMWDDENTVIRPKDGQTEILLGVTTTDQLIARGRLLEEFPGGYEKVLDFLQPGVPIGRFKFVKPGEALGMSFDGLVHVNDRWVLIPKPWRALP